MLQVVFVGVADIDKLGHVTNIGNSSQSVSKLVNKCSKSTCLLN
jgi:hypothetical protein